jgi:hypothetical protein
VIRQSSNSPDHPRETLREPLPARYAELEQKTGIDYQQLNLLRNPLLPRGLQESKRLIDVHNDHSEVSLFTMCENVNTMPERVFKDVHRLNTHESNNTVDIAALNMKNAKELKALQYQCNMVVSSGNVHQTLSRTTI